METIPAIPLPQLRLGKHNRFTMLAAGICTVEVTVSAINPTATYVGVAQFEIEAVPTP